VLQRAAEPGALRLDQLSYRSDIARRRAVTAILVVEGETEVSLARRLAGAAGINHVRVGIVQARGFAADAGLVYLSQLFRSVRVVGAIADLENRGLKEAASSLASGLEREPLQQGRQDRLHWVAEAL